MNVHPHGLQEVLKNLLWSSWYHSVPAKGEVRFTLLYTYWLDMYAGTTPTNTHTWCFPGWRREGSFLTPAQLVHALSTALCWLPHPEKRNKRMCTISHISPMSNAKMCNTAHLPGEGGKHYSSIWDASYRPNDGDSVFDGKASYCQLKQFGLTTDCVNTHWGKRFGTNVVICCFCHCTRVPSEHEHPSRLPTLRILLKSSLSTRRKWQLSSLSTMEAARGESVTRANFPKSSPSWSVHTTPWDKHGPHEYTHRPTSQQAQTQTQLISHHSAWGKVRKAQEHTAQRWIICTCLCVSVCV